MIALELVIHLLPYQRHQVNSSDDDFDSDYDDDFDSDDDDDFDSDDDDKDSDLIVLMMMIC